MLVRNLLLVGWLVTGAGLLAAADDKDTPAKKAESKPAAKKAEGKPEVKKADDKRAAKAEETAQPSAGPGADPAEAYQKLFQQWTGLLTQIETVQRDFQTARAADRPALRTKFDDLIKQGETLEPKLKQAAEAAFLAAPNKDPQVNDLLMAMLGQDMQSDQYERALPLARLLADHKFADAKVLNEAGIAADETNDYGLAEKYLKEADAAGALDPRGRQLLDALPDTKAEWAKEQATRAKEAKANDLPRVELKTTKGKIVIELFENEAPNAVANFISLVEKKYYDGLTFHRVLDHFMAQGGDPEGSGRGGPGYKIACECDQPNHRLHFRGSLSMAHAGKDTGGSQFFLTFVRTPFLDGRHTVFGRVIEGLDVLSSLERIDPEHPTPVQPDKILEAKVLRKRDHQYKPVTIAENE